MLFLSFFHNAKLLQFFHPCNPHWLGKMQRRLFLYFFFLSVSEICCTFAAYFKKKIGFPRFVYSHITEHIEIDRRERSVRKDGQNVHLTGLEYGLLDFLSAHANRVCSRQEILDHVWGTRFQYDPGTINVHLNALRRKLGWNKNRPVETVHGVGFIFRIEQKVSRYTIDLQSFLADWLRSHEVEMASAKIVPHLHLTPFVNELTVEPQALRQMLDGFLTAFLPGAEPGALSISSRLTMRHFILSLDLNGMVNELRIPLCPDV